MGEKLELEIVGKNSTTNGWDNVEAEAKARANKIRNSINREGGLSGNAEAKTDKSMQGKGFMEAFRKAIHGDFSGAIEDMQGRLGAGMKGLAGKAAVWGGGVATAFIAGWKAGKVLDEMLGISDKIGKALAGKTFDDPVLTAKIKAIRELRAEMVQAADSAKSLASYNEKLSDIRAQRDAKAGGAQGQLTYESNKMESMRPGIMEAGISDEERRRRTLEFEEQISRVHEASAVIDRDMANRALQEQIDLEVEHAAIVRAAYDAEKAAEQEKAAARKHGAEVEQEFARMGIRAEIAAIEAAMNKRKEQNAADLAGLEARKAKLQEIAGKEAAARAAGAVAADPNDWKKKGDKDKADAREKNRRDRMHKEAEAAQARGVKIAPRFQALLDADHAAMAAAKAGRELKGLEKLAAEAQIKAEKNIERMRINLDGLNKRLDAALTMGGGA